MNNADKQYLALADYVLANGRIKKNRTGIDTIGVFGQQLRFNLSEGFPLLTTKKVFFKGIVHELLWFLSGSTNIKYLVDNDVHIWDEWAYKKFKEQAYPELVSLYPTQQEYIEQVKELPANDSFIRAWAELGEGTYGGMWRAFPYHTDEKLFGCDNGYPEYYQKIQSVDQIQKVIDKLKNNPDDRRMVISAWHPYWVDHCALPPCHCLFQFHTEELTISERVLYGINNIIFTKEELHKNKNGATFIEDKLLVPYLDKMSIPKHRLNCQLYQRSCDLFLGIPFNIASYALLTHLMAHASNMVAGDFVHTYGDLHIYINHLEQLETQRIREPYPLPQLWLNPYKKNLFDFKFDDIKVLNYNCHPAIKGEVAV